MGDSILVPPNGVGGGYTPPATITEVATFTPAIVSIIPAGTVEHKDVLRILDDLEATAMGMTVDRQFGAWRVGAEEYNIGINDDGVMRTLHETGKVFVSAIDSTKDYIGVKITGTNGINVNIIDTLGVETLEITNTASSLTTFPYRATTSSQAPPTSVGRIKWNNIDQTLATIVYVNNVTNDNDDIGNLLENITEVGQRFAFFKSGSSSEYQEFEITSITAGASEITYGVKYINGNYVFSNNELMRLLVAVAGESIWDSSGTEVFLRDLTKTLVLNKVGTALDITGDLLIAGNIIQDGVAYETHVEQVYSKKDLIITREDAVGGLGAGVFSGIQAKLYDGVNDGIFGIQNDGYFRAGDVGSEVILAGRDEDANLTDQNLMLWDDAGKVLKDSGISAVSLTGEFVSKTSPAETMQGSLDIDGSLTAGNALFNDDIHVVGDTRLGIGVGSATMIFGSPYDEWDSLDRAGIFYDGGQSDLRYLVSAPTIKHTFGHNTGAGYSEWASIEDDRLTVNGFINATGYLNAGNFKAGVFGSVTTYAEAGHENYFGTSKWQMLFGGDDGDLAFAARDNSPLSLRAYDTGTSNSIRHTLDYDATYQQEFTGTANFINDVRFTDHIGIQENASSGTLITALFTKASEQMLDFTSDAANKFFRLFPTNSDYGLSMNSDGIGANPMINMRAGFGPDEVKLNFERFDGSGSICLNTDNEFAISKSINVEDGESILPQAVIDTWVAGANVTDGINPATTQSMPNGTILITLDFELVVNVASGYALFSKTISGNPMDMIDGERKYFIMSDKGSTSFGSAWIALYRNGDNHYIESFRTGDTINGLRDGLWKCDIVIPKTPT